MCAGSLRSGWGARSGSLVPYVDFGRKASWEGVLLRDAGCGCLAQDGGEGNGLGIWSLPSWADGWLVGWSGGRLQWMLDGGRDSVVVLRIRAYLVAFEIISVV